MRAAVRDKLPGNATRAEAAAALTELRSSMSAPDGQVTDASVRIRPVCPMTRSGACPIARSSWLFISPTILLLLAINIFPLTGPSTCSLTNTKRTWAG